MYANVKNLGERDRLHADTCRQGVGVKIGQNLAGVFYGWPLAPYQKGTSQESTCHW